MLNLGVAVVAVEYTIPVRPTPNSCEEHDFLQRNNGTIFPNGKSTVVTPNHNPNLDLWVNMGVSHSQTTD